MTCDQYAILVGQHRHCPPPVADGGGDFVEVGLAMEPAIVRIGKHPLDRPALDLVGRASTCRARTCGLRLCGQHSSPPYGAMPCSIASAVDLRPSRPVKQWHMFNLAGGFITRFRDPSMPSRTVLAAPSQIG